MTKFFPKLKRLEVKRMLLQQDCTVIFTNMLLIYIVSYLYYPIGSSIYSLITRFDFPYKVRSLSVSRDDLIDTAASAAALSPLLWISILFVTRKLRKSGYPLGYLLDSRNKYQADAIEGSAAQQVDAIDESDFFALAKLATIFDLDRRTGSIAFRNNIVLFIIALSLVSAVAVVIFAGKLTSYDVAAVSISDKLKTEIKEASDQLANTSKTLWDLERSEFLRVTINNISKSITIVDGSPAGTLSSQEVGDLRNAIKELAESDGRYSRGGLPSDQVLAFQVDLAKSRKEEALKKLQDYDALLKTALENQVKPDENNIDWRYFLVTGVTRIGVIVIIVFLVQILLGLYRYNTRLTTYYNSIKDVIRLYDGDPEKIGTLISAFGPPKVNFDKDPKHPLEDILKIINKNAKEGAEKEK